MPGVLLGVCLGPHLLSADPSARMQVSDQTESPQAEFRIDVNTLPDPFLSYFIRREQMASEQAEAEKQAQQKAQARLEQKKQEVKARLEDLKKARTELQTLNLSQLTLTAIVKSGSGHWAMVRDPKGQGYILKEGTRIGTNGGVVSRIAITHKKVIVQEPYIAEDELHIAYKPVEITLPDELY